MFDKVLVAMALDHGVSQRTLDVARKLVSEGGTITALHVLEEPSGTANVQLREDALAEGTSRAKELFSEKLAEYPEVEPALVYGHAARTIVDYATQNGVDCIVMASHQPGLTDYFLGSTASRVVRHAPCTVHVHRGD